MGAHYLKSRNFRRKLFETGRTLFEIIKPIQNCLKIYHSCFFNSMKTNVLTIAFVLRYSLKKGYGLIHFNSLFDVFFELQLACAQFQIACAGITLISFIMRRDSLIVANSLRLNSRISTRPSSDECAPIHLRVLNHKIH